MKKRYVAGLAAGALLVVALTAGAMAQLTGPDVNEGKPVAAPAENASAPVQDAPPVSETATPQANPAKDNYIKALDELTDEQAQMVPVVLATIGELACDGLEVDHKKAAAFVSSRAQDDTVQSRKDAADSAKATATALLAPWLTYVQQDAGPFCEKAYALHDGGRDLWKH